jgi:hypothetical protein
MTPSPARRLRLKCASLERQQKPRDFVVSCLCQRISGCTTSNSRTTVGCNKVNQTCRSISLLNALMVGRISISRAQRSSFVYRRRGLGDIYRTPSDVLRPCSVYLRISFLPLSARARLCVIGFADPIRVRFYLRLVSGHPFGSRFDEP